jgi:phosphoglucomutase/phosphomannomutase
MNTNAWVTKAKDGFNTLDVSEKYINSALKWLEVWLTDQAFSEYVPQIQYLIENGRWNFLLDSFYQVIPFGTGGRRGLVGIGPNRINTWTIQASAQGHSQYMIGRRPNNAALSSPMMFANIPKKAFMMIPCPIPSWI